MGSFVSFMSPRVVENPDDEIYQVVDREYIAIDQSGSLGSFFDDCRDRITGKSFLDYQTQSRFVNQPITCKLYCGCTSETENLLEMIEIDTFLQLSILSRVIQPNGIASIINHPQPIDRYTRFLYFNRQSFDETFCDELSIREEIDSLRMPTTSATHVITGISWGIHFVVVLQLPDTGTAKIDQLLGQMRCDFVDDTFDLELTSEARSLVDGIIATTVYSNIPDLVKLKRLDDVYDRILQIARNTGEHRRLKYFLTSIPRFDFNTDNRIEQVNYYLYEQWSQIKALKSRFALELSKLPHGYQLEEQANSYRHDLSRLVKLYESDAQKIHRLIHCTRQGELMNDSIDRLLNSEAQRQIKDAMPQLNNSLDILKKQGKWIKKLQDNGFEYWNVARLGIDQDCNEQLVEDILFKNNQHKMIFCSTDQLRQRSSKQWNALHRQIMEEKLKNPQLTLIYADYTYSNRSLKDMVILSSKLQALSKPPDEYINILLLGESGVGKSTFINAFANYLRFSSLQEAQSGRPVMVIPVSFLMTMNDNFEEIIVEFGEPDPNENHNDIGQSVTQQSRSYVFEISPGKKLRIIDTPGFADTRGDSQDEVNLQMIFAFVNNLTHLNGVCLLFKPNCTRLNPFLYTYLSQTFHCFGENIRNHLIYCFTNAQSTFYAPGDTGPLLKSLFNSFPVKNIPFEKKNTFCFDSESFRYLVGRQRSVIFSHAQEIDFEKSWTRSVDESKRLRNFLCNDLHPYRQNEEWQSVLHAQYQISFMVRPILETVRNNLRNILLYDTNCSIKLKATCVHRPTIICYKCERIPKVMHQFRINPDLTHHSQNECPSNEQTPTEYTLDYEPLTHHADDSPETLNQQQTVLLQTCVQFARFLQTTNARNNDPFLSGLTRMSTDEELLCREQKENEFNPQLVIQLGVFIEAYEQSLGQTDSDAENQILAEIYNLIKLVNKIPTAKEQIDAIKEYHHFLLTSNERNIDV